MIMFHYCETNWYEHKTVSETNKTPKWPKKNSLSASPEAEHEKNKGRSYSRFKAIVFTSTFALFPMTYLF